MAAINTQVASIYGANAAPVATTAATLGVTSQPVTTGGNSAVSTGYDPTPVATVDASGSTAASNASSLTNSLQTVTNAMAPGAISTAQNTINAIGSQYESATPASNPSATAVTNSAYATASSQIGSAQANDLFNASASTSGGGAISDALLSGVGKIAAFASEGMKKIQKAIEDEMNASGGEVDPAKMQLLTMKMSTYELLNQMAQKIQEKQDRAVQVWLQS